MRLLDKDLVKKLLMSNRLFTWNELTLQGDEAIKLSIFFMFVCLMYFLKSRMLQKKEAERDFCYFSTVFRNKQKEMIGLISEVFFDRVNTINYRTFHLSLFK